MRYASVFRDLAINILAVDGLERAPKKILKPQPEAREFCFLTLRRPVNDIFGSCSTNALEAFGDTVKRAGTRHHKITFAEVQQSRVVEIDCILEGEKGADSWILEESFVNPPE